MGFLLVPCNAPTNINVTKIDQTSVNVTWNHTACLDGNNATYVYIMYIENWNNDKNADWNIHGAHGYERQTVVNFLNPGSTYKAYMVQANRYGNGPPSTRFYIKTVASRNNKFLFFAHCYYEVISRIFESQLALKYSWLYILLLNQK